MDISPRIGLSYLAPQQAQKHVTVNETFRRLDALAQLAAVSASTAAEPGSPADGDIYIIPAGASGAAWGAMASGALAAFQDGAWVEIAPGAGWRAYVIDAEAFLVFDGAAWVPIVSGGGGSGRERLTADRTYYVRTDGDDGNDGLSDSAGGAFLTIQRAIDAAYGEIDIGPYDVTIQLGDGTYNEDVAILAPAVGAGRIILAGNASTPSNTVITGTLASVTVQGGAVLYIQNIRLATATRLLYALAGGVIFSLGALVFGACTYQMTAQGGTINLDNTAYTIDAGCSRHAYALNGGEISAFSVTVTLTGTPAFSSAFAFSERCSIVAYRGGASFSGSATGARYNVSKNAVIDTNGGGASFFPGDSAGSTATGGQYV